MGDVKKVKLEEFMQTIIERVAAELEVPIEILDTQFFKELKLWPNPEVEIYGKRIDIKMTIPALAAKQLEEHKNEGDEDVCIKKKV